MSGLMLYIPGPGCGDVQEITRRGAGDLLDPSVHPLPFECEQGPDGGRGWLVIFDQLGQHTPNRVDLAAQTWLPAAKAGDLEPRRYWVGFDTAKPPGPAELQRASVFDGMPVLLADGKQWVVPVADYLPQRLTRDTDTGDEKRIPTKQHREFVEEANRIREHMMSDEFQAVVATDFVIKLPHGMTLAGQALAKNYRVNTDVVDALDLLHDSEAVAVVMVIVGMGPWLDVCEKKNATETRRLATNLN